MTDALLDLPPEIQGPAAWYGPRLACRTDWLARLTEAEVAEDQFSDPGLQLA
jgi:hypothetical protein